MLRASQAARHMMSANANKSKQSTPTRGITRFPGITRDAATLKVNRTTLFRALTGEWKLPGLVGRYHELKRKLH